MEPTTSGAQMSRSPCWVVRSRVPAKVLTLKATVPTSWVAAAHQPIEWGLMPNGRLVRPRPSRSSPSLAAS